MAAPLNSRALLKSQLKGEVDLVNMPHSNTDLGLSAVKSTTIIEGSILMIRYH